MNRQFKRKIQKRWKTFLFWLLSKPLKPNELKRFKNLFIWFFEGCSYDYTEQVYETYIHHSKFEITNFEAFKTPKEVVVRITLVRPGILIGKGGHTIEGLKKYFNDMCQDNYINPIRIDIQESKLWHI